MVIKSITKTVWISIRFILYAVLKTCEGPFYMTAKIARGIGFLALILTVVMFSMPDAPGIRHHSAWDGLLFSIICIAGGWLATFIYVGVLALLGDDE